MKKQDYIDMGISFTLSPKQIESVLCQILWISREELIKISDISSRHIYEVQKSFYDLKNWVPEAYALQKTEFYGREFFVDERVLIPRIETELLVDRALKYINIEPSLSSGIYIDIGTGTGCIPVSIIQEMHPLKFSKSFALDISLQALEVAKENIILHKIELELRESDLLEAIFHDQTLTGKDVCITANLPYIKEGDHQNMWKDVVDYEPDSALYGGAETGFELYEKFIKQCFQLKQVQKIEKLHVFIEIGFDQEQVSKNFLRELGLSFEYFQDHATIARVIHIYGF